MQADKVKWRVLWERDFNARLKEWRNEIENRKGIALNKALWVTFLTCIINSTLTRVAIRLSETYGVIDLALTPNVQVPCAKFKVLEYNDSDHLPCVV